MTQWRVILYLTKEKSQNTISRQIVKPRRGSHILILIEVRMSRYVEKVCQCGCGETFMARASDLARGWGLYKNLSHANRGSNNPHWVGGRSADRYYYKLRSAAKHPLRHKCRLAYRSALRAGVLKRGCCEFCGKAGAEGHHENYQEPYNVRWLCRRHHRMADRWRRERELPPSGMPTLG